MYRAHCQIRRRGYHRYLPSNLLRREHTERSLIFRPSTRRSTIFHDLRCFTRRVHRNTGDCRIYPHDAIHVAQHGTPAVLCRRIYACNAALQSHTPTCHHPCIPRNCILPMDSPAFLPCTSPLPIPIPVPVFLTSLLHHRSLRTAVSS